MQRKATLRHFVICRCFAVYAAAWIWGLSILTPGNGAEPTTPGAVAPRGQLARNRSAPQPRAAEPGIPAKVYRYAQRLLDRHDGNDDGMLDPAEWRRVPGHPERADADADQMITLEELAQWIAAYGASRRLRLTWPVIGAADNRTREPDAGGQSAGNPALDEEAESAGDAAKELEEEALGRRDTKFYVSPKRLPAGLPDWFLRRDLDGDGQLIFSEFAPKATSAERKEFDRYDLNGDGVITARECLKAAKASQKGPKAP